MPVIGSQRPYGLAKYLKYFDWEPIVLTIKHPGNPPDGVSIIATDYSDRLDSVKGFLGFNAGTSFHEQFGIPVKKNYDYSPWKGKLIEFFSEIIAFPDREIGWYGPAVKAVSELLGKQKIDAIISTSYPVTAHLIARDIKRKYGIPWVADFRDLWTQNHYHRKFKMISLLERRMELNALSFADILVTISSPLADKLKSLHMNKEVRCITNGYDPEDFDSIPCDLTENFTITYTGRFYNGKRDPSILLEAASELIREGKIDKERTEIRFFGRHEEWLANDINKYRLKNVARICGFISREEALKRQKESQLLLLLLWNDEKEKGVYTGKIFEYLGARRPILALGGPNSIVRDLLEGTKTGNFAETKEQVKTIMTRHFREFAESGEVKYNGGEALNDYTYHSIAREYSRVLNTVAAS